MTVQLPPELWSMILKFKRQHTFWDKVMKLERLFRGSRMNVARVLNRGAIRYRSVYNRYAWKDVYVFRDGGSIVFYNCENICEDDVISYYYRYQRVLQEMFDTVGYAQGLYRPGPRYNPWHEYESEDDDEDAVDFLEYRILHQ